MKLTSPTKDPIGVDPRTRDAARPPADNSSNDSNSPPFDGVLADVGSNAKRTDASSKPADSSRSTSASAALAATVAGEAATGDTTIVDALIGLLGKNTGPAPDASTSATDAKGHAATDAPQGGDGDPVDSLLKRISSQDDVTASAQNAAPAVPTAIPTDVMSILLQGSSVKLPQAPAPDPGQSASPKGNGSDPKSVGVGASTAVAPPSDAQETIMSDLSVATHLAPVSTNAAPTSAGPTSASDKIHPGEPSTQTTTARVGFETAAPAAASSSNHAHGGEATLASAPATDPSVSASTSAPPIGMSFTPLRSIASAIGELAANNAPAAAATPDVAKTPALGVARTMTLQLNPAALGTVGIRLHLTGQTLDVQLTVSDPQTLGMISRERDTLTTALHDQSYQVNSLVIQDGGAAASSGGNNAANQGDTSSGNARPDRQNGGTGSDSQGSGRQGQGTDGSARGQRQPSNDKPPRPSADSRGSSLFV